MKSKFMAFYDDAERLSVKEGKSQREISQLLGVSEKTLSQWSVKGEWKRKRKEYLTNTRIGPADKLKNSLIELIDRLDPKELAENAKIADQITKIISAIEKISGGRDILGATIETMDRFTGYLLRMEADRDFTERVFDHIQNFFEETRKTA